MSWSTCGDSCSARDGSGNQTRTRSPDTIVANGGADCTEETSEDQACTVECPGKNVLFVFVGSHDLISEPQFPNS